MLMRSKDLLMNADRNVILRWVTLGRGWVQWTLLEGLFIGVIEAALIRLPPLEMVSPTAYCDFGFMRPSRYRSLWDICGGVDCDCFFEEG